MQSFDICANKQFVVSRERRTRKVTVKQNAGATKDYPEGLLLAINSDGKFEPATTTALCALVRPIPKALIVAGDVITDVVYYVGVGKEKIMIENESIRITEKFMETLRKNKLDIREMTGDIDTVKVEEVIVSGNWTNTQYTETAVDKTGLTFKAKYSDGSEKSINASAVSVADWGATAGEQTATFSYSEEGYTATGTKKATVVQNAPASLAVTGSWSHTQYTGAPIDKTGLTFKATYLGGQTKTVTSSVTVSPTNWGDTAGEQTATFSYADAGATVTVTKTATVANDDPASLAVSGDWTNEQIHETAVDPTGLTFTATLLSGATKDVTADVTVSPETWGETVGEQTATFSYTDNDVTVTVEKTATVA